VLTTKGISRVRKGLLGAAAEAQGVRKTDRLKPKGSELSQGGRPGGRGVLAVWPKERKARSVDCHGGQKGREGTKKFIHKRVRRTLSRVGQTVNKRDRPRPQDGEMGSRGGNRRGVREQI